MIIDVHRHMWSADQRHPMLFAGDPRWEGSEPSDFDWRRAVRVDCRRDGRCASADMGVIILAELRDALRGYGGWCGGRECEADIGAGDVPTDRLITFYGDRSWTEGGVGRYV